VGKNIKTLEISEASCLGAAILSGYALRRYSSIDEAVREMVKVKSTIEPDKELYQRYLKKYCLFKRIYPALKEINRGLSETES